MQQQQLAIQQRLQLVVASSTTGTLHSSSLLIS
jgi:hypothetical protein